LLALALLAACATTKKQESEQVLHELLGLLPGSYDNLAQTRQPGATQVPLRLMIVPVEAPLVSDHVFYVQEMAADDPRRVLAQRLYIVEESAEPEKPVMAQFDFAEPARWRDGQNKREIFRGLLPQDLRPRTGCGMTFTKTDEGFTAEGDASKCKVAAAGTGETLRSDLHLELDRDRLSVKEKQTDMNGVVMRGGEEDSWYRFVRRADAPW